MRQGIEDRAVHSPLGDARPEIWIVGDGSGAELVAAAETCGLRVSRHLTIGAAVAALAERRVALVLVEIDGELSRDAPRLLEQLDAQASDSRMASIVSCSIETLDAVASDISAPYATILCDPSPVDWIAALVTALPVTLGVAELDRAASAHRILDLTAEVARIARLLADLPDNGANSGVSDRMTGYRSGPGEAAPTPATATDIRAMIKWRRRREALFNNDLFADPAWDMILDLAAAQLDGVDVSVSSLCIAAAVPATTALRWIRTLTDMKIFERVADPLDGRRVYIRLADHVATAVLRFLGEAKGAGAALI